MKKKLSPAIEIEALRIQGLAERAAEFTGRPAGLGREIATRWYAGIRDVLAGRRHSTLGLLSEDLVGLLLAAHQAEPDEFGAECAADAAALSAVVTGSMPRPAQVAAARWHATSRATTEHEE